MNNSLTMRSEYKLAAVGVLSLIAAIVVVWQFNITVQALETQTRQQLEQEESLFQGIQRHRAERGVEKL